jgi:manganese transport protein
MNPLELFLGIMSALGGFVDIGELVFTLGGGAKFGYSLLWVVLLGTIGIVVFAEMSGRVAVVLGKPAFTLIRERMGVRRGMPVLIASNLVNLLTCAAEVGGIAIVLQMLFGGEYRLMLLAGAGTLVAIIFGLRFEWLERLFGLMGLGLVVYAAAAVSMGPDWGAALRGLLPGAPKDATDGMLVYLYFVVGIFSSVLMPYEIYFYSSGAIEEKWTVKDLPTNFLNAVIGFALGAFLVMAIIVTGAQVFMPRGIDPQMLSSTAVPIAVAFGMKALLLALLGMLFAIGGAAAETAMAAAYNVCQFFDLAWGQDRKWREVPVFVGTWLGLIVLGFAIAMSGVNPVKIVEYSVIFAVVVLPFTYYPILRTADDKRVMGKHVNKPVIRWLGWIYFVLITVAAVSAVPLMVVTHMGEG